MTLQKPIHDSKTCELAERTFVNLYTRNNISFGKGFIVLRQYYYKENEELATKTAAMDDNGAGAAQEEGNNLSLQRM